MTNYVVFDLETALDLTIARRLRHRPLLSAMRKPSSTPETGDLS